jgi:hypothetical protein
VTTTKHEQILAQVATTLPQQFIDGLSASTARPDPMPYLIRFTAGVALVAGLLVWLLSAVPLPVALGVAVVCGWVVFDLVQPF